MSWPQEEDGTLNLLLMSSRAWLALLSQQGDVQAPQVAAEDMAEVRVTAILKYLLMRWVTNTSLLACAAPRRRSRRC